MITDLLRKHALQATTEGGIWFSGEYMTMIANTVESMEAFSKNLVICRDCKWCMAYAKATYCDRFAHALPEAEPDGFCAWGERRGA